MRKVLCCVLLLAFTLSLLATPFALGDAPEKNVRVTILYKGAVKTAPGFIATAQSHTEDISAKIKKHGGAIKHNFESINAVSAEVTETALEELERDPNVLAVERSRPVHAFLQESVPLIGASDVWQRTIGGLNITGEGTSVCVIDSGVDYTHPDLGGCFGAGCKVISGYDFVNNDADPMDDFGHGTHVAGIVAANGGIKGVAPDAKIVAVKVLNATGSGTSENVIKAIDWCTANATRYNISAISMSLGGDFSSSFCDSTDPVTAAFIDAAIAKNVSVAVATGNDADYTGVSYPACVQNATRVGATYDANIGGIAFVGCTDATTYADKITCYTNRGINFPDMLLAPGSAINSTLPGDTYGVEHGTSMATPHVSGALALLSQAYRKAYCLLPPPQYLRAKLNETGVKIYDSQTALNFSRINVLAALGSLNLPNITSAYNNITGSNSAALTMNESGSVFFNMSVSQLPSVSWYLDDALQGSTSANFSWRAEFNDSGTRIVRLAASNGCITESFTWNVTVLDVPLNITSFYPAQNFTAEENSTTDLNVTTNRNTTQNTWALDGANFSNSGRNASIAWNCTSAGVHNISYTGSDGFDIVTENWTANVTATNCPPYISPPLENIIMQRQNQAPYNLSANVHDDDGDALIITTTDPENITSSGLVLYFNYSTLFANKSAIIIVNDSVLAANQTINITVIDTLGPQFGVTSPENKSYNTASISLSFSTDEPASWCGYSLNGTTNITLPSCANATFAASEGENNITLFANDTLGNWNSRAIYFTVDTMPPQINVAATNYTTDDFVLVNATISEAPASCILSFNGTDYAMEKSGNICAYNVTSLAPETYNFSVFANDSAGNINRTQNFSVQVYYCFESYGAWSACISGKKQRAHTFRSCASTTEQETCTVYSAGGGSPAPTKNNTAGKNETNITLAYENKTLEIENRTIVAQNDTRNARKKSMPEIPKAPNDTGKITGEKPQFWEAPFVKSILSFGRTTANMLFGRMQALTQVILTWLFGLFF